MINFYSFDCYRRACKIRAYLNRNNIPYTEWHTEDGYEFQATVTPKEYNELINI